MYFGIKGYEGFMYDFYRKNMCGSTSTSCNGY
jgi:hypothetical protein